MPGEKPSTAQAGCREPPDLLGLPKHTGGKGLRSLKFIFIKIQLKIVIIAAFSPNEANFSLSFQMLGF